MTGFHACFGRAMKYDGGEYGDLILSRFPVEKTETHALRTKKVASTSRGAWSSRM